MFRKIVISFILLLIYTYLFAQNTIGLLSYDLTKVYDGYNLLFPHNQPNVYLLNNCGEVVHVWEDSSNYRPGNTAYLMEDGRLFKAKREASISGDPIWAGGGGAILEIRDWDNELLWSFKMNDSLNRLHHDFTVTDEGNILAIAWELKDTEACIQAGRDTSTLSQGILWPDWILEIDPELDSIVWEWHAWQHLIQDFDSTKSNYSKATNDPHLIDVNYGRSDGHPDWMHANSIDYNSALDQILISVPYFDEIWIIDHSTTKSQAAGHFGGIGGMGGDLLWRWGNPRAYGAGDSTDQQLFFQHDAHWIDDYISTSHSQYGRIAVFNNRVGADFSAANILTPVWDSYDGGYVMSNGTFFPSQPSKTIMHPTPTKMYSNILSSVQALDNGNYLLTAGRPGYSFELTSSNEVVWEYATPLRAGNPLTQGDSLELNDNFTFRMDRIPVSFAAFKDKDLTPKGWLELEPDSTFCDFSLSTVEQFNKTNMQLFPNPVQDVFSIRWEGNSQVALEIHNVLGELIKSLVISEKTVSLSTEGWMPGIYSLSLLDRSNRYTRKFIVSNLE